MQFILRDLSQYNQMLDANNDRWIIINKRQKRSIPLHVLLSDLYRSCNQSYFLFSQDQNFLLVRAKSFIRTRFVSIRQRGLPFQQRSCYKQRKG